MVAIFYGTLRGRVDRYNAFHDGGLILRIAGRHVGIFLAFQTQRVPTDDTGFPTPSSRPLGTIIDHPEPTPTAAADIYIAQALINPDGADPGHEIVVLANLATTPRTLTDWTLTDHNGRTTAISLTVPAGATTQVALDGSGVQLGNNGGNLLLHDNTRTMIDSVVYSNSDAKHEDRHVRFRQ